jgi:hypothetical protein
MGFINGKSCSIDYVTNALLLKKAKHREHPTRKVEIPSEEKVQYACS